MYHSKMRDMISLMISSEFKIKLKLFDISHIKK